MLENNTIFANEAISHDAVLYNTSMGEEQRLKGTPLYDSWLSTEHQFTNSRRVAFEKGHGNKAIWFSGLYSTALVNLSTFKAQDIDGFWKLDGGDCFAMVVCANRSFSKIGGLGNKDYLQTVHLANMNSSGKVQNCFVKKASEVAPQSSLISELS